MEVCKVCTVGFRNLNELRLHAALEHPEEAEQWCPYCDVSFGVVSKEGPVFRHPKNLNDHLEAHPGTEGSCKMRKKRRKLIPDVCTLCGEVFTRPKSFEEHMASKHHKHPKKLYTCVVCYTELSPALKYNHTYLVHEQRPICEICGIAIVVKQMKHHKFSVHGIQEPDVLTFNCPVEGCKFVTSKKYRLAHHHKLQHDPNFTRNYSCQYCGKGFKDKKHMERHENIHTNAVSKPYICEICGRSFPVKNYLYIHKRCVHYRTWNNKKKKT